MLDILREYPNSCSSKTLLDEGMGPGWEGVEKNGLIHYVTEIQLMDI